jgi:hypothetical protein
VIFVAFVLYFAVRTTVIIDRVRGILRVHGVPWRRGIEWQLQQVRGAEVHVIQGDWRAATERRAPRDRRR